MDLFRETSSLQPVQNNLPAETVKFSLGNSRTLPDGVTDLGSVVQEGFFLRLAAAASWFFLTALFRVSSDGKGALSRSKIDGCGVSVSIASSLESLILLVLAMDMELDELAHIILTAGWWNIVACSSDGSLRVV